MLRAPSPLLAGEIAASTSNSWWDDSSTVLRRRSGGPRLRPVTVQGGRRQRNAPPSPGRTRRYYFPGISPSPNLQGEVVQHTNRVESRHFDVKLPAKSTTEGTDGSFEDHLEFRYVDFLEAARPTLDDIGVLTKDREADVGEIAHFLDVASPRTRLDAYPMWILAKQIIRLLLQKRIGLRDREMERLKKLVQNAQDEMTSMHDQLVLEQKTNVELRARLSDDEQKLLEEEDRIKRQQLELFKLHAEIEREKKQINMRASQNTIQSQRIQALEAEREQIEAKHAELHAKELEAQYALSKQLRMSERNRKELEEALASPVHQAELRRKIQPILVGWRKAEKNYALAMLLAEEGLEAAPKRTGPSDSETAESKLKEAAYEEMKYELEDLKQSQLKQEQFRNQQDEELRRLKAELAASKAASDQLKAEAAARTVGTAGGGASAGGGGGVESGDGTSGIGASTDRDSTVDPGVKVPWTMVITREAEVFELRDDVQNPSHAQTIRMTQGETVRIYEETVDGEGIAWVRTSRGWMRRDAGNNCSELYEMLQKQQAGGGGESGGSGTDKGDAKPGAGGNEAGGNGAGGSAADGNGADGNNVDSGAGSSAGNDGGSDGAAAYGASSLPDPASSHGGVQRNKSTKIRDARSEKLLKMYHVGHRGKKGARPMPVQNIVRLVDKMYEAKVAADEQDDRKKHRREALPIFIQLFLIQEFGLKSIADKNLKALIAGVHKFSREEEVALGSIEHMDRLRIVVFGELAGMGEGEYSWVVTDCMMDLVHQLFGNVKAINEKLNKEECTTPFDHALRSM